MTTGYHIDPENRTILPITYTATGRELNRILDTDCVAAGERVGDRDMLYVDDNGYAKPCRHFFALAGCFQPVPHGAILVGPDHYDPETEEQTAGDPTIGIDALRALVTWMTRDDFVTWIRRHARQPAVQVGDEVILTWQQFYDGLPKV